MAHWIRQQMISSCCRGHSTSKERGWGQDSTPLWLMTGPPQRLPVGKNVTLNWMWRGPTFKLHLTRLQNNNNNKKKTPPPPKKKKPWQIPSWVYWWVVTEKLAAPLAHTITKMKVGGWQGSPDILLLVSSFCLFRLTANMKSSFLSLLWCPYRSISPTCLCNNSSIQHWTTWSFNWNQAWAGIKYTATWVVVLPGPIITLLISVWLSRRRDRSNLWSLTRWHKAFQASRPSSAKVISTN